MILISGGVYTMTKEELKNQFLSAGLSTFWADLGPYSRNAIVMIPKETAETLIPVGASKLGGLPDLPPGTAWPQGNESAFSFIAQMNLEQIKPYDSDNLLPDKGMLYFFHDLEAEAYGYDPKDKRGHTVLYFDGDLSGLTRTQPPKPLSDDKRFDAAAVRFYCEENLPHFFSSPFQKLSQFSRSDSEAYWAIVDEETGSYFNKLLGHSDNMQGAMESVCQLATNGIYCDSSAHKDPRAEALEKDCCDWKLLMQIDSNDELGMMWGVNCGRLYLWIREQDLANRNFDNTWLIYQEY